MEHLIYREDFFPPYETREAHLADILRTHWTTKEKTPPFTQPFTKWLGFEHTTEGLATSTLEEYPRKYSVNERMIWQGNLAAAFSSPSEMGKAEIAMAVAAFLQSWLYFGLLETIVRKPVDVSYLVRTHHDDRNKYLYSWNLHFCLSAWKFSTRMLPENERKKVHQEVLQNLVAAHSWISRLNGFLEGNNQRRWIEERYPGYPALLEHILPPIIRLANAVNAMRLEAPTMGIMPALRSKFSNCGRYTLRRRARLVELGWCPFTVYRMEMNLTESLLDWMMTLHGTFTVGDHSSCGESGCLRDNINVATYKNAHDTGCGDECPMAKPSLEGIRNALERATNTIPVISIDGEGSKVMVTAASVNPDGTGQQDYVAISHVWADGLGSTSEQGIPQCQARRLLKIAQNATGSIFPRIWIDSLCIPGEPALRKKAIKLMRDTYANASKVVVIDSRIRQHLYTDPKREILCAIYSSSWMQRLWTYQESLLSKSLSFLLASDELFEVTYSSLYGIRNEDYSVGNTIIWWELSSQLVRIIAGADIQNFGHVGKCLQWRSTSKPIDELAAVAGLLNLHREHVTHILDSDDPQERMRIFLKAVKRLPPGVIFLGGLKIESAPFRWAPRTFMSNSPPSLDTTPSDFTAECRNEGILSSWRLLKLHKSLEESRGAVKFVISAPSTDALLVYRVSTLETWPEDPIRWEFTAVVLNLESGEEFGVGRLVHGAAVLEHDAANEGQEDSCDFVGLVFVERMDQKEFATNSPMLPARKETLVVGQLCAKKMWIT